MEPATFHFGLIGWPLEHSLSPAIHQAALDFLGLRGEYRFCPVPPSPDGERELRNLLRELRQGIWDGFNLTVPHKRSILPYLDGLSSVARAVGAVNTIYQEGTQLIGENTDVTGFQTDLKRWLDRLAGAKPRRKFSLVLGAGGAARAVAYALAQEGWQVTIAARRLEQANQLAEDLQFASYDWPIRIQAIPLKAAFLSGFEPCGLVVNATPAGMFPDCDVSPWPPDLEFPDGIALYDLVYNPAETALVRAARRKGFPATNGLGMLVEQAALAFEGWTGKPAPRGFMRLAAERALGEFQVQKSPSSRPERNRRR